MSKEIVRQSYENLVELKYQLYNSLFLTLPLDAVEQTGLLLPLLEQAGKEGLERGLTPQEIIEQFFAAHRPGFGEQEQANFLFKIIQYVERQVVLVDALEDAAFSEIHQTDASNRLDKLNDRVVVDGLESELADLLGEFGVRVILTAHPTQFYPGQVLAIITDLREAVQANNIGLVRELLQQLGNTPFFNKQKPTPRDEAMQLSWYLGNIFYPSMGKILDDLAEHNAAAVAQNNTLLTVGFWPGGDRDGNPFVTTETTRDVAEKLRFIIIECYRTELRNLKRRLSFSDVYEQLEAIEKRLHAELTGEIDACFDSAASLLACLDEVEAVVRDKYQGLFVEQLRSFKRKVAVFGFHFASLDIRQDSRVLASVLDKLAENTLGLLPDNFSRLDEGKQVEVLLTLKTPVNLKASDDSLVNETLEVIRAIKDIQQRNGELACHRFIISNCSGARDVANLVALFRICGWSDAQMSVDIVPLFETVKDLQQAGQSMAALYASESYREHLVGRGEQQTVMLGFSDGTKDGGYLMANWAIYSAKESLTSVSRNAGIEVIFFDGRGGPPARGGGNTYKFYAALGKNIETNHIQLTVQGQTISSYYGTELAALHNLRQLLAAGLENNLYDRPERELSDTQRDLIDTLASLSYEKYLEFKQHPLFLPYLEQMSTLHFYAQSNIGSRPAKRGSKEQLRFEDLRAIPFVGAWGQLKQNVPGYYGLGSALKAIEDEGRLEECQALYRNSKFFAALIGNSMQSMCKTNFQLTSYMKSDPEFGEFWEMIYGEFKLSREMVLKVSGQTVLLDDNPTSRYSISLRQDVVLPLLLIQQYALMKLRTLGEDVQPEDERSAELYEKMIVRSLFGNINASRNSA